MSGGTIVWNNSLKLILADVDETIADVYTAATPEMIAELTWLLKHDLVLFLVTGAGLESVQERIVNQIDASLRHQIIVAHCSGAEVCVYDSSGELLPPIYSVYDSQLTQSQKAAWRGIVRQLLTEFQLKTTPTMSVSQFQSQVGDDPFTVMLADRGPQITLEFVNSYDLSSFQLARIEKNLDLNIVQSNGKYDLRVPFFQRAEELLRAAQLPIGPHVAGVFALDLSIEGVSKTTAIEKILTNQQLLKQLNLPSTIMQQPELMEIWGDKFEKNGGSDRKMCVAVHPQTRAIDFRQESPELLGNEFNIITWNGQQHLHNGTLEYLQNVMRAAVL